MLYAADTISFIAFYTSSQPPQYLHSGCIESLSTVKSVHTAAKLFGTYGMDYQRKFSFLI